MTDFMLLNAFCVVSSFDRNDMKGRAKDIRAPMRIAQRYFE